MCRDYTLAAMGCQSTHPLHSWSSVKGTPAGSSPRVCPSGTLMAGYPFAGEKNWLLSPCGVLRSPMIRGGVKAGRKSAYPSMVSSSFFP